MSEINITGLRVVRGAAWKWANQDGGEGNVGTVVKLQSSDIVIVLWDSGLKGSYSRNGLRVLDNYITGVRHGRFYCDECPENETDQSCIIGFRWRCQQCPDYDLCNDCYYADKHNTSHCFIRYDIPGHEGARVPARRSSKRIQAKGLYAGATVRRGRDWKESYGDHDGGSGKQGKITNLYDAFDEKSFLSHARVRWSEGRPPHTYRRGYNGYVDVQCVTPANGELYYPKHLPTLGDYGRASPSDSSDCDSGDNDGSDQTVELVRQLAAMLQPSHSPRSVSEQPVVAVPAPSNAAAPAQSASGTLYNYRVASYIEVRQQNGFVSYAGPEPKVLEREVPVGLLVAQHPFDESCNYFEIEIVNTGKKGEIAVGVVPDDYPLGNLPGWRELSMGYHADNGGIYQETLSASKQKKYVCTTGDRMGCGVEIERRKASRIYFTKNGKRIFQTAFCDSAVKLYPAVGMHSRCEMVILLDPRPWRL